MEQPNHWRKCGSCKKEIMFRQTYQACSVSSCKKHVYCSVDCWNLHQSVMNHKSAWACEETAPTTADNSKPRRRIVPSASTGNKNSVSKDILIVASKLKAYVKDKHDMNTSGNVMEKLSDIVRYHCDNAVENARREGRKTLMDRDFQ